MRVKSRVGSKLIGTLVDWAESQRGLRRLQARVREPNERSMRLLERFDFSKLPWDSDVATIRGVKMAEFIYYRDFERGHTTGTSTSK